MWKWYAIFGLVFGPAIIATGIVLLVEWLGSPKPKKSSIKFASKSSFYPPNQSNIVAPTPRTPTPKEQLTLNRCNRKLELKRRLRFAYAGKIQRASLAGNKPRLSSPTATSKQPE